MKHLFLAALTAFAFAGPAQAAVILTMEGVGHMAGVNDFYNGGAGGNFGIQFAGATALVDVEGGGTGNFANEPSPSTIAIGLDGPLTINVFNGFDTGFSLFYTSAFGGSVSIYDALNGTGNVLTTFTLLAQAFDSCTGDPNGSFCNWTGMGGIFSGIGYSVVVTGVADQTGIDDVTFDNLLTPTSTPEPSTFVLAGLGLTLSFLRRWDFGKQSRP
jgi:hypothetical protein